MPVKKDPSGRRSIEAEVEVPGTPEEVWQAIATGPGITSWFVPSTVEERVGGTATANFGPGMESVATIKEWDPPRRFMAETVEDPAQGPVATEWIVEARAGGLCVVRVVHSWFASSGRLGQTVRRSPGRLEMVLPHPAALSETLPRPDRFADSAHGFRARAEGEGLGGADQFSGYWETSGRSADQNERRCAATLRPGRARRRNGLPGGVAASPRPAGAGSVPHLCHGDGRDDPALDAHVSLRPAGGGRGRSGDPRLASVDESALPRACYRASDIVSCSGKSGDDTMSVFRSPRQSLHDLKGRQRDQPTAPGRDDVRPLGTRHPDQPRRPRDQTKGHRRTDQDVGAEHPATVPVVAAAARVNDADDRTARGRRRQQEKAQPRRPTAEGVPGHHHAAREHEQQQHDDLNPTQHAVQAAVTTANGIRSAGSTR